MADSAAIVVAPLRRTMYLVEGGAIRTDKYFPGGVIKKGVHFQNEIVKGDVVALYRSESFSVTKSADADVWNGSASGAVGVVVTEPEGGNYTSSNGSTQSWAKGNSRVATVEFFRGSMIKELVVVDAARAGAVLGWTGSSMSIAGATTSGHIPAGVLLESSSAGGTHSVLLFQ